ncbi:MAG: alpha/beta hydrolase, partial [Gemmatimonadetes bacterium]|nr:alpha/beta hydrolase [Gemmatimonadota bacterium]
WAAAHDHPIAGALLVAPADVERPDAPEPIRNFAPVPLAALPFPAIMVASSDDPYLRSERAAHFARCWGARLVDLGAAGHINTDAGFGPWPQGLALLDELDRG